MNTNVDDDETDLDIIVVPICQLLQQMLVLSLHIFVCLTNGLQEKIILSKEEKN